MIQLPIRMARKAAALTIAALVAIAAILSITIISLDGQKALDGGITWRVISKNVTIHGKPVVLATCVALETSCSILIAQKENSSSLNVELVEYEGSYYYLYTQTASYGGIVTHTATDSKGETSVPTITYSQRTVTYTMWVTNSTVYCISPQFDKSMTCPP